MSDLKQTWTAVIFHYSGQSLCAMSVAVRHASVDRSIFVGKVLEKSGNFGFDAKDEEYGDRVEKGIIDPTKVIRVTLKDATTVGYLLITTEAMIAEKTKAPVGGRMPDGGMDFWFSPTIQD